MSDSTAHLAPQGIDDSMEISSDFGVNHQEDIDLDLDDDYPVERQDEAMEEGTGNQQLQDNDMDDGINYHDEVLDDPDEELQDATEDYDANDVDVVDAAINPDKDTAASDLHPGHDSNPGPSLDAQWTSNVDTNNTMVDGQVVSGENPSFQQNGREQSAENPEQHTNLNDNQGQHGQQATALAETIPSAQAAKEDSRPQDDLPLDASHAHDGVPSVHNTPPTITKEQLRSFPVTLRFADTDNNLFPLAHNDSDDQGPGYLLEDRSLMKKSINDLLHAFRTTFGRAIPENSLLGLEFPRLDLKLDEQSPFASETGCCLQSFIEIYVSLSRNDCDYDPPPFTAILHVEDGFYSRFQFLRSALNDGKGLSQVVQAADDDSFEKHGDVDDGEYDDGEENSQGEQYDEGVEEFEAVEDVDHDESQTNLEIEKPVKRQDEAQKDADNVSKHEESGASELRRTSAASGGKTPEDGASHLTVKEDNSKSDNEAEAKSNNSDAVASGVDGGLDEEENVGVRNSDGLKGAEDHILTDKGPHDPVYTAISTSAASKTDSPSLLNATDSTRAQDDEESLLDYSEEEPSDTSSSSQEQSNNTSALGSSPGNDRKRKLGAVEETQTSRDDEPNKLQKLEPAQLPVSAQPDTLQNEHDAPGTAPTHSGNGSGARKQSNPGNDPTTSSESHEPLEDTSIDFDHDDAHDESRETLPEQSASENPGEDDHASKSITIVPKSTGKQDASLAAPADEEEDLINYESYPDGDSNPSPSINVPSTKASSVQTTSAGTIAKSEATAEEEDLIDYSDEEDLTPTPTTAN